MQDDGSVMKVQVMNNVHPDDKSAIMEYECFECDEKGISFGWPAHIRAAENDLDLTFNAPTQVLRPRKQYECARKVLQRG